MRKHWSVPAVLLVAAVFVLVLLAPVAQSQTVVHTVTVGLNPYGVAYDLGKNEIFVTNSGSKTVSVISDTSNTVVASVNVGAYPFGAAYDPGRGYVYVANAGANTVSVISDTTNTVIATVNVGLYPYGVAFDLAKGEAFVVNEGAGTVSVISDTTNSVVATVSVGSFPYGAAYDVGKAEVFVTNSGSNTVSVISDASNTVVATIHVGAQPYGAVYDSAKGRIFVTDSGANAVDVISDTTNALVTNIGAVGTYPYGVAYDSVKGEIFVTNGGSNNVAVISDTTDTVTATANVGAYPFGAVYDSVQGEVYVTDAGSAQVSVLSDKSASTTSVVCSPASFGGGSTSTCTVTVTGGSSPVGTVSFTQSGPGSVTLPLPPTCALTSGSCSIVVTGATAGGVLINATYGGDTNNLASSGTFTVTVTSSVTTTTTGTSTTSTTTSTSSTSTSTTPTTVTSTLTTTSVVTITSATTITTTALQSSSTVTITISSTYTSTSTSTILTSLTCTSCVPTLLTVSCNTVSAALGVADACIATVQSLGSIPTGNVIWSASAGSGTLSASFCQLGSFYEFGYFYSSCSVSFRATAAPGTPATISANYLGDSQNSPSLGSENLVVAKRGTSMTVSCAPRVSIAGSQANIACLARVFGYGTPTGNITLSQSGVGSVMFNKTSCVLTSGSCTLMMTPLTAGVAKVKLTYIGDPNNGASARVAALTVTKAATKTVLGCLPSSLAPGSVITCKATIFGLTPPPTGTVTWLKLSGAGRVVFPSKTCTLALGGCSNTIGVVSSGPFTIRALYGGDTNNLRSSITIIIKASPTITPNLSLNVVTVKHSVTDSAVISNGFSPTGTVSYQYFVGRTCSGTANPVGTPVKMAGGLIPGSAVQFFVSLGNYSWSVVYSGDANNYPATGPCQSLVVNKEGPVASTVLSATTIAFGSSVTDSVTLTGTTFSAGGTVIYEYFTGGYCAGTPTDVGVPVIVIGGATSPSIAQVFKTAGTYSWNAVYSGDLSNNGTTSSCERLNVRGIPTIYLTLSVSTIPPGGSIFAVSTLNGTTPNAGGTVQYEFFSGSACSGVATIIGSAVGVTNSVVPGSASQQFGVAGTYSFNAVYSGDANNNGATSACTLLTVAAPPATTTTTTTAFTGSSTTAALLSADVWSPKPRAVDI